MKLTEQQLKKIIQEELSLLDEAGLMDKFRKGFQQGKDWWNKKPAAGGAKPPPPPPDATSGDPAFAANIQPPQSGQQPKPQIDPVAGWKQLEPLLKQTEARYKQQGKPFNADAFKFAFYEMAREDFSKMSPQEMNNQFTKLPSELRNKAYEVLTGQKATGAAASATAPAAGANPKLTKRMELFKQNMPQYFQTVQTKMSALIKYIVGKNVQSIKEQTSPADVISTKISKEITNALNNTLKTITPEEFQQAYQILAKKKIKDPKQLGNVLKSFRGLEEQETVDTNPLASSEIELLDTVLQVKKIGLAGIIKQAAEKALNNPQTKRYLPDEQAKKVIDAITASARTVKQLISTDPSATAQTIKKSQFPDATRQEPAATSSQPAAKPDLTGNVAVEETKKASLNENRLNRMKLLAGIIKK